MLAKGRSRQLRCHAIVQHAAAPKARAAGLRVSVHMPHDAIVFPGSLLCRALQFCHQFRSWQAEEAVANVPLRLAVRVHCGHQVRRGTIRGTEEALSGNSTLGVLAAGIPPRDDTQHAARNAPPLPAERAFPRSESFSCRLERACG